MIRMYTHHDLDDTIQQWVQLFLSSWSLVDWWLPRWLCPLVGGCTTSSFWPVTVPQSDGVQVRAWSAVLNVGGLATTKNGPSRRRNHQVLRSAWVDTTDIHWWTIHGSWCKRRNPYHGHGQHVPQLISHGTSSIDMSDMYRLYTTVSVASMNHWWTWMKPTSSTLW